MRRNFLDDGDIPAIKLENIAAQYFHPTWGWRKSPSTLFKDFSVVIPTGTTQLLGFSGGGKTTLLKAIDLVLQGKKSQAYGFPRVNSVLKILSGNSAVYRETFGPIYFQDDTASGYSKSSEPGNGREEIIIKTAHSEYDIDIQGNRNPYTIFVEKGNIVAFGRTSLVFGAADQIEIVGEYVETLKKFQTKGFKSKRGLL